MTRKRAPGRVEDHPDVFFSISGGVDSVAAMITSLPAFETDRKGGNFAKKPVAIYLDTKTGTPLNRLYAEQVCDAYGIQLWTLRTDESFREWLLRDGAPGPGAHQEVRNELKDRQASKLITLSDNPVMVLGIAADESDRRASYPKVREMPRHTEIYPCHRLSRKERVEIILRDEKCPVHPLWCYPKAIRDCACGCFGDPSEYDVTEDHFPVFMQQLRAWEEAIEYDGLKGTLGWGGLGGYERDKIEYGHVQSSLTVCEMDGGCDYQRDPTEVRAFKAVASGESRERAVEILNESHEESGVKVKQ